MPAHSSLKVSDSHNTLKSSIVPGSFSALSLKLDATRHTFCITTPGLRLNIHTPGQQPQHSTTATQSILNPTPGGSWARCQLSSGIRFILRGQLFMKLRGLNGVGCWRSQNSMADSSTTTRPILDPIAGDCWARRQLPSGIKDVSVTSRLMKSLTLLGVVFIGTLAIPELDGRVLHDRWTNPESDCGRLLGSTPATQRYKIHPSANFIHDVTGLNGVGCWRSQNSMEDSSTTAGPILDLIAGECWARRQLRSGIKDASVASKLRKSLTLVRVVFIGTLAIPELDGRFLHDR